jgi:hypothetical protein
MTLGIDLQYQGASGHFVRQGFYFGRGHAAGAAPVGPEIDKHRDAGFAGDLVKCRGVHVNGFGGGGQSRFAGAAASGVREMFRRDTIFRAASRAGSNDRKALCCILTSVRSKQGTLPERVEVIYPKVA